MIEEDKKWLNPWGEWVKETSIGERWVAVHDGWIKEEKGALSSRFLRVSGASDLDLLVSSWRSEEVVKSYHSKPEVAFSVWFSPCHTPTECFDTKNHPEKFRVVNELIDQRSFSIHICRAQQKEEVSGWEKIIKKSIPSTSIPWGVLWGLIEKWTVLPNREVVELGVKNPWYSVSIREEFAKRYSLTTESRVRGTPTHLLTRWPAPPSKNNLLAIKFKKDLIDRVSDDTRVILWGNNWDEGLCSPEEMVEWSIQALLFDGVIVWDSTSKSNTIMASLRKNLNKKGVVWTTKIIQDEKSCCAYLWEKGVKGGDLNDELTVSIDLNDWCKSWSRPLEIKPDVRTLLDGRVRMPLSNGEESEAWAPIRLAYAMSTALARLKKTVSDPWAEVAKEMGFKKSKVLDVLSPEQLDAVFLAINNFNSKSPHSLITDQTGFGKGRMLASLVYIGIKRGKNVLFVTENDTLFSDFYRDLTDVVGEENIPEVFLVHNTAKVFNQKGQIVVKDKFKDYSAELDNKKSRLFMSTYAQFGRKQDKVKVDWLRKNLNEGCWIVLDEVHKASGDSQSGEFLGDLVSFSSGTVSSSATFAKQAKNMSFFMPYMPGSKEHKKRLIQALSEEQGGSDLLRSLLTEGLALDGKLVRREHPPVPPPMPIWISVEENEKQIMSAFSDVVRNMYSLISTTEVLMGLPPGNAWQKFGAGLSRASREFSIFLKVDYLVKHIKELLDQGIRPVVGIDSTLENALKMAAGLIENENFNDEEEDAAVSEVSEEIKSKKEKTTVNWRWGPHWKYRWMPWIIACESCEIKNIIQSHPQRGKWEQALADAKKSLEKLPNWSMSPIDEIRHRLSLLGISSCEVSGRKWGLKFGDSVDIARVNNKEKTKTIQSFNDGVYDVIFITRSGSVGVSLHASKTFKDQRQRCLIEWDISNDPVVRVQFWGRVRRRDQLSEPLFHSLSFNLPSEIRRQEKEERKRLKLGAHAGTAEKSDYIPWVSKYGERVVHEWSLDNPSLAKQMGVYWPILDNEFGKVDRALMRSWVLSDNDREKLVSLISRGVSMIQLPFVPTEKRWRSVRERWWGGPLGQLLSPMESLKDERLRLVERVSVSVDVADIEKVKLLLKEAKNQGFDGSNLRNEWSKKGVAGAFTGEWLKIHLKKIEPWKIGDCFKRVWSSFGLREALFLGFDMPAEQEFWAPSQIGVNVWVVGCLFPSRIPLDLLMEGELHVESGMDGRKFIHPPYPLKRYTVEGNPVLAAEWGQRWRMGEVKMIDTVEEGERLAWLLPEVFSWEKCLRLPRDLPGVDGVRKFWMSNPNEPVFAALPAGQDVRLYQVSNGYILDFSNFSYIEAEKTWFDYAIKKHCERFNRVNGRVKMTIPLKKIIYFLEALKNRGVHWRCDCAFENWLMDYWRRK